MIADNGIPNQHSFNDNPIVYHLITDRFCHGDSVAPTNSGHAVDAQSDVGSYHGGNFRGVMRRIKEGWFTSLGVNAILISAPYEQIYGWVPGANAEFKHYPYHGYYALDYTVLNKNFGTDQDLRDLISVAHRVGIRVLIDIVMNHPGYPDLLTLSELSIDAVRPNWEMATPADYYDYLDRSNKAFLNWWGPSWVRCALAGYDQGGTDDLTMLLAGLPDFKTESREPVALPAFLKTKKDTCSIEIKGATVRDYLVAWLTSWVGKYGIDGFRCDSAKHVELDAWSELKRHGSAAYAAWKEKNPVDRIDDGQFWMTGEVFGNGIERSYYHDFGFDNLINFRFEQHLKEAESFENLFEAYAQELSGCPGYNVLSYLSSHDTRLFDRGDLIRGGTALLLAPGGVQIFYGDETARPAGPFTPGDPAQATRSDMNWHCVDQQVLTHWRKLGQFRSRHVSIARGIHRKLGDSPYLFVRVDESSHDRVMVALDVRGGVDFDVHGFFNEGDLLRDAYSGAYSCVRSGRIQFQVEEVMLLERVDAT